MQTSRSLRGPVTVVAVLLCLLAALLAGQQAASASPGQVGWRPADGGKVDGRGLR